MDQPSTSSAPTMQKLLDRVKRLEELADRQMASLRRIELALTTEKMELMSENAELRAKNDFLEVESSMAASSTKKVNGEEEKSMDLDNSEDIAIDDNSDNSTIKYDAEAEINDEELLEEIPSMIPEPTHTSTPAPQPSTSGHSKNPSKPRRIVKSEFKVNGSRESFIKFQADMMDPINFSSVVELMQLNFSSTNSVYQNLPRALITITNTTVAAETIVLSGSEMGNEISIFERRGSDTLSVFGRLFVAAGVLSETDVKDKKKRHKLAVNIGNVKIKLKSMQKQRPKQMRRDTLPH